MPTRIQFSTDDQYYEALYAWYLGMVISSGVITYTLESLHDRVMDAVNLVKVYHLNENIKHS